MRRSSSTASSRFRSLPKSPRTAHCFFEWIYFANVASTFDDRSVYLTRKRLGEELAKLETLPLDRDTIVVPVPDTAKAAADAMAYQLNVPSQEGLIRNRYVGRTFIEGQNRADKVRMKYTALPEVLEGKRVLLVEDTIVRSTTMKALISQLKGRGRAGEVHVRIACPPIIAPCFYGIDMSTVSELFAPRFMEGTAITPEIERKMAAAIGADSLRYLPLEAVARCLDKPADSLVPGVHQRRLSDGGRRPALPDRLAQRPERATAPTAGRTYDAPAGRVGDSLECIAIAGCSGPVAEIVEKRVTFNATRKCYQHEWSGTQPEFLKLTKH